MGIYNNGGTIGTIANSSTIRGVNLGIRNITATTDSGAIVGGIIGTITNS
jgi:hypothetical protein